MATALLLALGASLAYGASDFLGGITSRRLPLPVVLVFTQAISTALVLGNWSLSGHLLPSASLLWGFLAGVGSAAGGAALYKGLAIGTMGIVEPISSLSVLVPVAVGIVTGESMSLLVAIAAAVALCGTLLATRVSASVKAVKVAAHAHRRSVQYAIGAALGFGITTTGIGLGSRSSVTATVAATMATNLALFATAALIWWRRRHPISVDITATDWLALLAVGLLGYTASMLLGQASSYGKIALVAVLAALYPVVTALLGRIILQEKLSPGQYFGVGLVVVSVVTLASQS